MDTKRITAGEAALRLRISRERVARLIQAGRLRGGLQGGRYFADPRAVEQLARAWARERAPEAASA